MKYVKHLSKDKKLKKIIQSHGAFELRKRKNVCHLLCASIMSQQLSTKVADVIHKRFLALYGNKVPKPEQIISTPHEALRSIGLSNAKAIYIKNVAQFSISKGMAHSKLSKMTNDEIIEYLTEIKGVGRWTVEMLLMFTLGREDVFAADDLGIQTAMKNLYGINSTNKKKFREKIILHSNQWTPYRTYACMHLWKYKDLKTK